MAFDDKDVKRLLEHAEAHSPWIEYPLIWKSKSAYFAFLRGELRRLWTHWRPRNELKMEKRVQAPVLDAYGKQKRYKTGKRKGKLITRYELSCEVCRKTFPQAEVEVDHLDPCGSCNNIIEACTFLLRLLVSKDKLQLVCKKCHKTLTYAERMGISFEESELRRKVIHLMKEKVDKQKRILLKLGYTNISNKENRAACYRDAVNKGMI